MQGLRRERACLHSRRACHLHARTPPWMEGEALARHATVGQPWLGCAGGGSTAFSGDRAQRARRKAVDAPEALYRRGRGAPAALAKQQPCFAPWWALAPVRARLV